MEKELIAVLKNLKEFLANKFHKYDTKLPYIITTVITAIIVIGGIKLFINLTENLKSDFLGKYDAGISEAVFSYRAPLLTDYFVFVTNFGDTLGYVIVFSLCTLLFYLILKRWKYVAQIAMVMILALSSNLLLKKTINRARPEVQHLVDVETLSYPSGHAMMAMAFYGFLIYLVSQFYMNRFLKTGLIFLSVILILSIGISRIYLGVHYPSDIAGGFIAGFIWVIFCIMIFNLIKIFKRDPGVSKDS